MQKELIKAFKFETVRNKENGIVPITSLNWRQRKNEINKRRRLNYARILMTRISKEDEEDVQTQT